MAQGQIAVSKEKPKPVTCRRCRHFLLDTKGPNYNAYTHEYFMGESDIGCDPDHTYNEERGTAKIFADKPRLCKAFKD